MLKAKRFVYILLAGILCTSAAVHFLDLRLSPEELMETVSVRNSKTPPDRKLDAIDRLLGEEEKKSLPPEEEKGWLPGIWYKLTRSLALWSYRSRYDIQTSFAVVPVHAMFKVDRGLDDLPSGIPLRQHAAKGEWESFQLVLLPFDDTLRNVRVHISSPFAATECWQVGFVNCLKPAYSVSRTGWYADPLIAMDKTVAGWELSFSSQADPFTVNLREAGAAWVNYYIPPGAAAGDYVFSIQVSADTRQGRRTASSRVLLHVWDYTLPRTMHLKTAFSFDPHQIEEYRFYGDYKVSEERNREYYSFLLSYRLNPVSLYTRETYPPLKDWPLCIDQGANAFCVNYIPPLLKDSGGAFRRYADQLKLTVAGLKEKDLLKYAYLYGFDEVLPPQYPLLRHTIDSLKHIVPELPVACTVVPDNRLEKQVDIWVPLTASFDSAVAAQYRKKGDQVWWYVCCFPDKPGFPNFFTEYPAIAPRLLFWQTSRYNLDGFLYYNTIAWQNNTWVPGISGNASPYFYPDNPYIDLLKQGRRWPDIPWFSYSFGNWNGDGQLIYPGRNGQLWPSIRLVNIRDGIEDYEYMHQLKLLSEELRKIRPEEASKMDELLREAYTMVPARDHYENNPARLLEVRKRIGEMLEKYAR
jgi:hypothetical protein